MTDTDGGQTGSVTTTTTTTSTSGTNDGSETTSGNPNGGGQGSGATGTDDNGNGGGNGNGVGPSMEGNSGNGVGNTGPGDQGNDGSMGNADGTAPGLQTETTISSISYLSNRWWGPSSEHAGSIIIHSFADGRIETISDQIDPTLYLQLITANGHESSFQRDP